MKKRIAKSAIAVALVLSLMLSMAACDNVPTVTVAPTTAPTKAPVATTAPTTAPTQAPVVTTMPTTSPLLDTTESQLSIYGITFPDFDLTYSETDYANMSFGATIDSSNKYQEAYDFEMEASITAVNHAGDTLSKSKFKYDLIGNQTLANGYQDAGSALGDWSNKGTADVEGGRYMFTVGAAGVYTVQYKITVSLEDKTYGYYTPEEFEEVYILTKTYTVNKAEIELKTTSDAFLVSSEMQLRNATVDGSGTIKEYGYTASTNITSCLGTEVGEYPLYITIKDEKGNEVYAEDIALDNYVVTLSEGVRYILSAEEIARANTVRKMTQASGVVASDEYSKETIKHFASLSAGEKILAGIKTTDANWNSEYAAYLIESDGLTSSAVDKAQYDEERSYLVEDAKELLEVYATSVSDNKKEVALGDFVDMILKLDNSANDFDSDMLFVLKTLGTSVDSLVKYTETDDQTVDFGMDSTIDFTANPITITLSAFAINAKIDQPLLDWLVAFDEYKNASWGLTLAGAQVTGIARPDFVDSTINQKSIEDATSACDDMKEAFDKMLDFQKEMDVEGMDSTVTECGNNANSQLSKDVERWNAYMEIFEAYNFDDEYVYTYETGDDINDLLEAIPSSETFALMTNLLGYTFNNADLGAYCYIPNTGMSVRPNPIADSKTLSNIIFHTGEYIVPDLFLEDVIEATKVQIDLICEIQSEVEAIKAENIQFLVDGGMAKVVSANLETAVGVEFPSIDGETHNVTTLDKINAILFSALLDDINVEGSAFMKEYKKNGADSALAKFHAEAKENLESATTDFYDKIPTA